MSSSGSKPGFKDLVIEHGEKFILGLAGLFVLIGIGTTQWSTYEKKPEEFSQKIDAGKAEFACTVPSHFADRNHHIPCAVPRAALLGVEAVSAGAGVSEGCVDVTVPIDAQIAAAALPSEFARVQMRVAPAFGL